MNIYSFASTNSPGGMTDITMGSDLSGNGSSSGGSSPGIGNSMRVSVIAANPNFNL